MATLAYLLLSDWTYERLRDGFHLGTAALTGAGVMLVSSLLMMTDRHRHDDNPEFARIARKQPLALAALLLLALIVFASLLSTLALGTSVFLFSAGLYYLFGIRKPKHLALCVGVTTVLITVMFVSLGNNMRTF